MTEATIRNWLGIYFLITTSFIGFYILLFGETPLLPIEKKAASSAFEIIIPVFVGQLTLIFKWFANNNSNTTSKLYDIPHWVVKGPPIIVAFIIVITIITYIALNSIDADWKPSSETFQTIITFCVTIINATTVFVISSIFKTN